MNTLLGKIDKRISELNEEDVHGMHYWLEFRKFIEDETYGFTEAERLLEKAETKCSKSVIHEPIGELITKAIELIQSV